MRRSGLVGIAIGILVALALAIVAFAIPANAATPLYTALGDSYSSGVGTRTYINDGSNCQRSVYAYPYLDATQLEASLTFAACGGATVASVLSSQLGSLSASTSYVTLTVGGNDAGFSAVIQQCALPWPWTCWGQIDSANAYIKNTLPGTLDNLYSRIHTLAPNARVVIVGYPRIFNDSNCQSLARISPGEQSSMNSTADLLDTTIAARASAHGFKFVDPRTAFTGHAICDPVEWINGLSNPTSESYHPNRTGQASGYAPLVRAALLAAAAQA
ncbi:MAG: SGNH/GDSL hydrolase family protein [Micromonosporaceae bacterium]|nr:SGNH/GDSL hydrolase family protein [Micromonosporaceae bacterium]